VAEELESPVSLLLCANHLDAREVSVQNLHRCIENLSARCLDSDGIHRLRGGMTKALGGVKLLRKELPAPVRLS
jgi:hypothetical protein